MTEYTIHTAETARLEAILFACGDPISEERLAEAADLPEKIVREQLDRLKAFYATSGSSLTIKRLGRNWQLCTRETFASYIRTALMTKKTMPLSNAAMEALTIVAYNQPVTKSFVEHVRGIDSSSIINSLVEKGLMEEAGRMDIPGRPIAYRTTDAFLRSFGLSSLEELPPLPVQSVTETGELANTSASVVSD